jgi:hypothetical protein
MADWFYSKGGQQQGPVNSADLKKLAREGQIQPDDLVWQEGMAEWAKASRVKGLFAPPSAPVAPAVDPPMVPQNDMSPPALSDIGPAASPGLQYATPAQFSGQPPEGRSGMALASLICGLVLCFPVCSLLAIVFGIIGIQQTGPGKRTGRGMAISGLILGCVGLPLTIIGLFRLTW